MYIYLKTKYTKNHVVAMFGVLYPKGSEVGAHKAINRKFKPRELSKVQLQ